MQVSRRWFKLLFVLAFVVVIMVIKLPDRRSPTLHHNKPGLPHLSTPGQLSICLLTAYVPDPSLKYPEIVVKNHQKYASKHRYHHVVITERMVAKNETDHWNKIVAIKRLCNREVRSMTIIPDWIVWLDSDAVVLDLDVKIEDVILHYQNINPQLEEYLLHRNKTIHNFADLKVNYFLSVPKSLP